MSGGAPPPAGAREQLLQQARTFLGSESVRSAAEEYKRDFLLQKGLTPEDIDGVLRDSELSSPLVPPRTYPYAPPSNLVPVLLGLTRLLKWIAGGSAVVLAAYYVFILPRLNLVLRYRHELTTQQTRLLQRLQKELETSNTNLKDAALALADAPARPASPVDEASNSEQTTSLPYMSSILGFLRSLPEHKASLDELLEELTRRFRWFDADPLHYKTIVLHSLPQSADVSLEVQDNVVWVSLQAKDDARTVLSTPAVIDLKRLAASTLAAQREKPSSGTLQSFIDLTGYVSSQTYSYVTPYSTYRSSTTASNNSAVEDVKREIRSLKGLVLNRMSVIPGRVVTRAGVP